MTAFALLLLLYCCTAVSLLLHSFPYCPAWHCLLYLSTGLLSLPPQDATEYVHRAGRAGRIGSTDGGEVVTVVTREELPLLLQMVQEELGLHVDVLELDKQPAGGLGLLGADYGSAREELLAGLEGELGQEGGEGTGGGDKQGQQSEEKLEAARKGLEDLFNLM
jgi:superfamily II DNA/RNA helicase